MRNCTLSLLCAVLLAQQSPLLAQDRPANSAGTIAQPSGGASDRIDLPDPTPGYNKIGPLTLGMSGEEVLGILGPPKSRTTPAMIEAKKHYEQEWSYPERGVKLVLSSGSMNAPTRLEIVHLTAPSEWEALSGLRIGMPLAQVDEVFKAMPGLAISDFSESSRGNYFAGFEYSWTGLAVLTENGVVSRLYLGPIPDQAGP